MNLEYNILLFKLQNKEYQEGYLEKYPISFSNVN